MRFEASCIAPAKPSPCFSKNPPSMKRQNRLTSQTEAQEQQASAHQSEHQPAHEFASVEEMLRHDALHTPVPPAIAHRLQKSIAAAPPPPTGSSWWRRIFG